jgi:prepilin-type N-terminal cleavage/methylation domain-containing protein
MNTRNRGFTLIELLIAVSIFVFLIMLAGPMYAQFMANSQIRNAGEAMLNGVRLAQTTAISANAQTQLVVATATGWQIQSENPDTPVAAPVPPAPYSLQEGAANTTLQLTPAGATQITFDGFGRIVANADATATISCINVTNSKVTGSRDLRVVISNTGIGIGTKLCDPAAAATEPQACPAISCT